MMLLYGGRECIDMCGRKEQVAAETSKLVTKRVQRERERATLPIKMQIRRQRSSRKGKLAYRDRSNDSHHCVVCLRIRLCGVVEYIARVVVFSVRSDNYLSI